MPYVLRNKDNNISALLKHPPTGLPEEYLPSSHPDIIGFLSENETNSQPRQALEESDADLARITEDLINLLVKRNIILFTDLPKPVQQKLLARQQLRNKLTESPGSFIDDSESI